VTDKKYDSKKKSSGTDKHADLLAEAHARFKMCEDAEKDFRDVALEDLKFSVGEQWPDFIKNNRDQDQRPCLTINRLPQFIHAITNEQRQNRFSGKVSGVDDNSDQETAEVLQGLIRHNERNSNADAAYDNAFDNAVRMGRGFWRIVSEYESPYSFNQILKIKQIKDQFSVYFDPSSVEPDGSDATFAFVFQDLVKEDYESQYPDSELTTLESWRGVGDERPGWADSKMFRVAEYYYLAYKKISLVLLSNGMTVKKDEIPEILPEGITILSERESKEPYVKWCKFNATEVLEETEIPIPYIPVIPVYGDDIVVDGERILEGIVRHSKDSQRMYNFFVSAEAEAIALTPKAPYVGAEGQFEGYEAEWQMANKRNLAFLQYKPVTIEGQLAPAPTRNIYEPPVQAITNARLQASEDMKATTSIYDAAIGRQSNETSGVAIQSRRVQAQTSNFHYVDNLRRSIRHSHKIQVCWMPKIYDTERMVRIIGEDDSEKVVRVNEILQDGSMKNNLSVGMYDVTIDTGPSFATKRQEAAAQIEGLVRAYPQMAQFTADLLIKNMDWPYAKEIAERLKKTLPPGIADDKDKKPLPPEAQAQMAQMSQMIEALTTQLNESNRVIEMKRLELESRERIEFAKIERDYALKMFEASPQSEQLNIKTQQLETQDRLNLLNINQPVSDPTQSQALNPQAEMPMGNEQMEQQPLTGELPTPGQPSVEI
jgi:hypothetical protein